MNRKSQEVNGKDPLLSNVLLRDVAKDDLPIFFEQQLDPTANYMAAFTRKNPEDLQAFMAHWLKIMGDNDVKIKTILFEGDVVGSVLSYIQDGKTEVSYWIGKEFWGKGIATQALALFLDGMRRRPVYARAARDNLASIRVLEKCGFIISGYEKGFANARGERIDEVVMRLF